jgi:hypothetical protein
MNNSATLYVDYKLIESRKLNVAFELPPGCRTPRRRSRTRVGLSVDCSGRKAGSRKIRPSASTASSRNCLTTSDQRVGLCSAGLFPPLIEARRGD